MSTFHFQPIKGQAREILTAILKSPEVSSCHIKEILVLRLACEEIVMNITSYAYPEGCASREQNGACSDSAEAQPALAEGKGCASREQNGACSDSAEAQPALAEGKGCASREQNGACSDSAEAQPALAEGKAAEGFLDVDIQKTDRITIRFEDGGVPFNPLKQEAPDTKLSWKKRRIGGLGIFLVRRKMDDVRYVYENGKNVLTIEKRI